LSRPLMLGSRTTQVRASVGVVAARGVSVEEIIAAADAAMYAVKAAHRQATRATLSAL
jgi:GGDEF domain-containing protein